MKSYFAKAIGNGDLTVGASSTAKVVFTVDHVADTTSLGAGGPCALCILNPTGLTLDGQNGDVTITDGNVIVNSTAGTAASLNPNGHVKITTDRAGRSVGPGSCSPARATTSRAPGSRRPWSQQGAVTDPLANVPQCGNGSPGTTNYCPTTARTDGRNGSTLLPGIYGEIKNTHTLSPGIYVITGGITLNGNDLIQGDGVMLYFVCSHYPTPCAAGEDRRRHQGDRQRRAAHHRDQAVATARRRASLCPYVGMMSFADRNNTATQTWRGNGTNENGSASGHLRHHLHEGRDHGPPRQRLPDGEPGRHRPTSR